MSPGDHPPLRPFVTFAAWADRVASDGLDSARDIVEAEWSPGACRRLYDAAVAPGRRAATALIRERLRACRAFPHHPDAPAPPRWRSDLGLLVAVLALGGLAVLPFVAPDRVRAARPLPAFHVLAPGDLEGPGHDAFVGRLTRSDLGDGDEIGNETVAPPLSTTAQAVLDAGAVVAVEGAALSPRLREGDLARALLAPADTVVSPVLVLSTDPVVVAAPDPVASAMLAAERVHLVRAR